MIAALSFLAAIRLWVFAAVRIISPNSVSLTSVSRLMYGLELAGPYMALLVGAIWALIAWGLFRLYNWARWAGMLVSVLGVAALVPKISMAPLGVPVFWYGLQITLYAAVGWYLAQAPAVVDAFVKKS